MADEEQWSMCEDGCLNVNSDPKSIIYHPNLNVILVISKSFEVYVIDVNSGATLHKSSFNAPAGGQLQGAYLSGHDKLLLTDGSHIGLRSDYNGVLLLDSILQPPVTKTQQVVRVELPYSEAVLLHKALSQFAELPGAEQLASEVTFQLAEQIQQAQTQQLPGNKAGKWRCIILEMSAGSLWLVFSGLAQELKRQSRQIPAMTVASALCERLNTLAQSEGPALLGGETNPTPYRALMFSEAARRATFSKWPHMNYKWALPDQMAQAGFYHQPNCMGDDRAMCFTCNVCLVCWEPTDEPWSEHERHSPSCPFVKGESTQNVPLSVSYATQPALRPNQAITNKCLVDCIGTTSARDLVATSSKQGHVVLWNIARQLKEEVSFIISDSNELIQNFVKQKVSSSITRIAWSDTEPETNTSVVQNTVPTLISAEVEVTAMCVASCDNSNKSNNNKSGRPCLVIGTRLKPLSLSVEVDESSSSSLVQAMNFANQSSSIYYDDTGKAGTSAKSETSSNSSVSCLLLYDIQYTEGNSSENNSTNNNNNNNINNNNGNSNNGGTESSTGAIKKKGHTGTRQENNIYSESFLSTFLYEAYDVTVIEDAVDQDESLDEVSDLHPAPPTNAVKFGAENCLPPSPMVVKMGQNYTPPVEQGEVTVEPNLVQCFGLPEKLRKDLVITSIHPTKDGLHLLVTLGVSKKRISEFGTAHGQQTSLVNADNLGKDFLVATREFMPNFLNFVMSQDNEWTGDTVKWAYKCKDGKSVVMNGPYGPPPHVAKSSKVEVIPAGSCILTNYDGELNIVSSSSSSQNTDLTPNDETFSMSMFLNRCSEQQQLGAVLLYSMNVSNEAEGRVVIQEQPLVWRTLSSVPVETLLLPSTEKEGETEVKNKEPQGLAAIVCRDGAVRILDVASLSTVATAKPSQPSASFVSVTYCNSLEQLCLCSDAGKLHFFSLVVPGAEQLEEDSETVRLGDGFRGDEPELISPSSSTSSTDLLAYQPLTLTTLRALRQLTRCANLTPCFTANAPACWSEMMQAQKQRRHPQHLQQGGEELHHTRTWRLQHESGTWDEHVFELTLPRSCCVGHVDVKFTLHSVPSTQIQVTLLRLNTSGIGRKEKQTQPVDEAIEFNFGSCTDSNTSGNPVTSDTYSLAHNTEVLCGPVNLSSAIDLSGLSGLITLTSPALLSSRSRTLLVHIKALPESTAKAPSGKVKEERTGVKRGRTDWSNISEPTAFFEQALKFQNSNSTKSIANMPTIERAQMTSASKKFENLKGCDWIHEVSITIRRTCRTNIPNERSQRRAMLESLSFVEQLSQVACLEGCEANSIAQSTALDVLLWVCSVQLTRYRGPQRTHQASQIELVQLIERWMIPLVLNCLLLANRSVAHKFAKLCTICSEGLKNAMDTTSPTFDNTLLGALLTCMPMVPKAESAGALRWFFMLLNRKAMLNPSSTGQKCMTLLQQVASELGARNNPSHMLLRTRFGLYGLPLEPEIFDMDPPQQQVKASSTPLSYATVTSGEAAGQTTSSSVPTGGLSDLKGILNGTTNGVLGSTDHHMRGLLETQPLHFTCHSASDGTKLETAPTSDGLAVNSVWDSEGFAFPEPLSSLRQSDDDNSVRALALLPWQQLLTPPPQQTLVIERMHSGARRFVVLDFGASVALTDLFIPACADLVSLSIDLWSIAEETDGQRLVVAADIGTKSLVMSDLQPPPICRYLKVTTIGRYGMSTARCRIPIGLYYGHMVLMSQENNEEASQKLDERVAQTHQAILQALVEDAQCRHSLACAKLKSLVAPFLQAEQPSVSHLYHFLRHSSSTNPEHQEEQKIVTAYQECIAFQRQLSVVRQVLKRLRSAEKLHPNNVTSDSQHALGEACTDKLRVMADCLLDTLLGLTHETGSRALSLQLTQKNCLELFQALCVGTEAHTQLAACSLLVRVCGHQHWWGDFLADSLVQLFGARQSITTFPQDRVFILLSYLGRKSLMGGARNSILESVLKALGQLVKPLNEKCGGFVRAQLDLCLIGWLLLFLSSCLDACIPEDRGDQAGASGGSPPAPSGPLTSSNRWTFIQGQEAMQKHLASWSKASVSRCYSRKLHKRLMHHSQQLKDLEAAKKAFQTSTQALSALSSQAANLSSKLEAALKAQEQFLKKTVQQHTLKQRWKELSQSQWRGDGSSGPVGASSSSASSSRAVDDAGGDLSTSPPPSLLPQALSLPVAKGLVALILNMDFTCNADLFLLACKVLSGIVGCVRPAISLSTLLSEEQLLQLVRLAVWSDWGPRSLWGGPWVSHAICCLLQDLLEVRSSSLNLKSQDTSPSDEALETPQSDEAAVAAEITEDARDSVSTDNNKKSVEHINLPSLLESEDSELEDLLEDIWVRGKYLLNRKGSSQRAVTGLTLSVSTAMDARLEYGVEWNSEVILRRMSAQGAHNLPISIASSIQPIRVATPAAPGTWDEAASSQTSVEWSPPGGANSATMLSKCFDQIFTELHTQSRSTSLEQALQLWHTLAQEGQAFDPAVTPLLQLQPPAVSGLMAALAWHPGISLCTWTLAFQCLTLVANQPKTDGWAVTKIVEDRNFLLMLKRFLSGEGSSSSCGPMACQNLNQLLVRLSAQTGVEEYLTVSGLKDQLLQLLLQLVSPGGALAIRQGPLDAQCKLLEFMQKLTFENVDPNIVMNYMDAVGVLVFWTIQDNQVMTCRSSSCPVDSGTSSSSARCFGGLFASVLGGEPRHSRLVSWDNLICSLLTLATKLVQTPVKGEDGVPDATTTATSSVSQSDEDKEHSKLAGTTSLPERRNSTLADAVLQRQPSMLRFLSSLGGCSGSTLAMVLGSNAPPVLGAAIAVPGLSFSPLNTDALGEPLSVGDAVFNLLSTLAKHTSTPELILIPLLNFLSSGGIGGCAGVLQLSEPLLWLILRVLSGENTLEHFISMGGIQVICRNLVRSSSTLINTQPSLVSMIMQHLYRSSQGGASTSSKKNGTQLENIEGMLNFAPLGCISSSNLTTQPADTLLQSSPPHRRARTPAWSYHFYPDEAWVELTITLPCAILLKEVHLMPHLTSLATCPAAVAIEISREPGSGMLPVCPPLTTSGFTFVRLHLPTPEVAGAVLIRLYKPRDSSNIGLSQIRLLGSTTFGDSISSPSTSSPSSSSLLDIPDEALVTKSSLGWLRLLHFCIGLPTPKSELAKNVVAAAAAEEGLLDACCALLLVPAPPTFAPSLEHVLLHLGLHSPELGLSEINTLLHHSRSGLLQGCMPSSSSSVYSVVELLAHLCLTDDSSTKTRVGALLSWLQLAATNNVKANEGTAELETWSPCAAYVHAIAAILWASHEEKISYDLTSLITLDLFNLLYTWTIELPVHGALKRAVDCVLCSMCYINPDLFNELLQIMGLNDLHNSSPNQSKEKTGVYKKSQKPSQSLTKLTENQLMSIAMACQSPAVIEKLLISKFPHALTHCILEWCSHRQISDQKRTEFRSQENCHKVCFLPEGVLSIEGVAIVLDFLADICAEGRMRDWLGSPEGSLFWLPLLHKLCNEQIPQDIQNSEAISSLQSSTVQFLSRCCSYHPRNQQLLSQVLCDVIRQQNTTNQNLSFLHGLPGFTRRLVLQLLLESERVTVAVRANCPLHQGAPGMMWQAPRHPRHGTGHQNQLLLLRAQSTCGDILKLMTIPGSLLPLIGSDQRSEGPEPRTELWDAGLSLCDRLNMAAAGVTARDKRAKEAKNSASSSSGAQASKTTNANNALLAAKYYCLQHIAWPGVVLPISLTMAQLLAALHTRGESLSSPGITLVLSQSPPDADRVELTLPTQNLATPLQVFAQIGGLALLAKHLPLVYPQALRIQPPESAKGPSPDPTETDWVKVDVSEDFLDDLEEMPPVCSTPKPGSSSHTLVTPTVPPHSLVAFGLFLRLPGYAEVLLRDRKKAQCLLRLVLGVSDDGEGGDIFSSSVASALPTLPFQVLRELFDSTPLNSDDGILLRAATMDLGAVKLLLNCLAHFTHHTSTKNPSPLPVEPPVAKVASSTVQEKGRSKKPSDDKSHLYWAKGTGFGTGSTQQSWNVEQALQRQRGEEEYVTVLLQVLASFINPLGAVPAHFFSEDESSSEGEAETKERMPLPASFPNLLQQSCLLPAVSSYLRNDSVLDMARHIPLYSAVLQLLRAMAFSTQLATLLLPGNELGQRSSDDLSVVCLLTKMKSCVDNYASRLNRPKKGKSKKQSFGASKQDEDTADQQDEEGLAQLIPDIQETANLVQLATERLVMEEDGSHPGHAHDHAGSHLERPIQKSLEDRYLEVMRKLRFDTYEMVTECEEGGGFRFVVSYHFEANMRAAGDRSLPSRVKRLAQETVTLATSLPLSYSSSVFVRCDADRLDVMKVLITGPAETPYANGCFEFDVFFPPEYPSSPMLINLQTTGHHTVRFNPNLYNDGKVCLSVLNTWHGRPEEKWNAHTSSFLQVLVSIQSLILVPEPYFNEPGYERSRGTPSGTHSSREYNSNIYQATVRWAMLEQLRQPSPCFKEVVQNHFWMKRREIEQQVEGWIKEMESQTGDRRTGRAISVNTLSLKRHYRQLKEELAKLKAPAGLEDLAVESSEPVPCASQDESCTAVSEVSSTTSLAYLGFTPSNTSTPLSAPSTPPTPTVSDETPPEAQTSNADTAEATSEPLTPSYDPKLIQHV